MVLSGLEQKGGPWLSLGRRLKEQAILLEQEDVVLKTATALNPAMFLKPSARNQDLQSLMESLRSIQFPAKEATMHCKAHQLRQTPVSIRNRLADKTAREVAE